MTEAEISLPKIAKNQFPEKLISSTPHLRYINEAFAALRQPYKDTLGEKVS